MSKCVYEGKAPTVAQVSTLTISSNTNTHTFTVSLAHPSGNGGAAVLMVTVTADGILTTTQLAAAVVTAWALLSHRWAYRVTCTSSTNVVTFTAQYPGEPFVISKGGTGTSTLTTTTANSGPNDYGVPSNWINGAVPVASDDIEVRGPVAILYSLDQSAVSVEQFIVTDRSATIGWAGAPLKIVCARFEFNSTAVAWIDIATSAISIRINGTAFASNGNYGLWIKGSAIATMYADAGCIGVAMEANDTATATTIHNSGAFVEVGVDTTLTNYRQTAGSGVLRNAGISGQVDCDGGTLRLVNTGTLARVTNSGGCVIADNPSAITQYDAYAGSNDFSRLRVNRGTIGTLNEHAAAKVVLPPVSDANPQVVTTHNKFGKKVSTMAGGSFEGAGGGGFGVGP